MGLGQGAKEAYFVAEVEKDHGLTENTLLGDNSKVTLAMILNRYLWHFLNLHMCL
jgi:hypothetical protein